jgi:hypothetical protein
MPPFALSAAAMFGNNPGYRALAIAVLVTSVVFVIARRLSGRPGGGGNDLLSHSDPTNRKVPEGVRRDRRKHPRRPTYPVPIRLESPSGKWSFDGTVMDRSRGGLRLAVPKAMAVGTQVRLGVADSHVATPPVEATVRWCSKVGGRFEVGCQFAKSPPWNVLLLFG